MGGESKSFLLHSIAMTLQQEEGEEDDVEEEEKLWSPDMILSTVTPSSTSNIPSRERRREWVEEREEGEGEQGGG